jgi:hypothetical protein
MWEPISEGWPTADRQSAGGIGFYKIIHRQHGFSDDNRNSRRERDTSRRYRYENSASSAQIHHREVVAPWIPGGNASFTSIRLGRFFGLQRYSLREQT